MTSKLSAIDKGRLYYRCKSDARKQPIYLKRTPELDAAWQADDIMAFQAEIDKTIESSLLPNLH